MINLILWRHAEAEVKSNTGKDVDRALTKRGRKDAKKMARWLIENLPENTKVLCSPAQRCIETLSALQELNDVRQKKILMEVSVVDYLSIGSKIESVAKEVLNYDVNQTFLIVGHQPNLGQLIAKLLGMVERACLVKKGSVWWLRQHQTQYYLYTVQLSRY